MPWWQGTHVTWPSV